MVSSGVGKVRLTCYMLVMSWITPVGVAIGIVVISQGAKEDNPDQAKFQQINIAMLPNTNSSRF